MEFENLSREELKELCQQKGFVDYNTLSKSKLIRLLINAEPSKSDEKLQETVGEVISNTPVEKTKTKEIKSRKGKEQKNLSPQALKWKSYLGQLKVTPKDYLVRFPDHMYRRFIEELI